MPQAGLISQYQFLSFDGGAYSNQGRNLKTWWNFEDFVSGIYALNSNVGIWVSGISGAAALIQDTVGYTTRPGVIALVTGTTTTGYATLYAAYAAMQNIAFGGGTYTFESDVYIDSLSTVGEEYILRLGFGDNLNADFVDGVYFEYDRLGSGNNWFLCSSSNSARTKVDSTIPVGAAGWIRLKIIVNANASIADMYINNSLCYHLNTNIPSGSGRELTSLIQLVKSAGTTPRTVRVDWIWLHFDLTASR